MKRLAGLIMLVLIIYSIYYDLSHGTLPAMSEQKEEVVSEVVENEIVEDTKIVFFEKVVGKGDTVLSIVEESLDSSIPVSIQQVVQDFEELNKGLKPEQIQYGKTYKFPDYKKVD
ncbi:hypothetical protein ACFYKX_21595 [Cytobacillus sp. FJAT-54145]|uniref:LysM domain-containing protein n=1 Tax=Cytobacillus spartinae TaxID=3299023 RepID=A0ABW6KHV7_9BACI